MAVEFKVRKVTKYIVTRYESDGRTGSSTQHGTHDSGETAYHVAYALCKAEHDRSGEPVGSMNFIYPDMPESNIASPAD